jgi:uncharacterized protein (DUF2336 family)
MPAQASLIAELEDAIQHGSSDRRLETLRRVTDLYLLDSERLSEEQIAVFDEVLSHLIVRMESKALIELSERLAPINNAPNDVVQTLARHNEIAVAGPILSLSERLTTNDLVEIAKSRSQDHLLAMSKRRSLNEAVTDTLIERGNGKVIARLVENSGARFSDTGYARLIEKTSSDESLLEKLGLRVDIPLHIFRQLLARATEAVRARLHALAPADKQDEIRSLLLDISSQALRDAETKHDFAAAQILVKRMQDRGELNQVALVEFAKARRYAECVAGLACLCSAPIEMIERMVNDGRNEGLLIPCKAAGLSWLTMRALLQANSLDRPIAEEDMNKLKADYIRLSQTTAQRVLRFWCTEHSLKRKKPA